MEAAKEAGVSPGVVDGLIGEGTLEAVELPPEPIAKPPELDFSQPKLTGEQEKAAEVLRAAIRAKSFSVHLLDGVTGSGKTEVYFEAIAEAVREGKQRSFSSRRLRLPAAFLDRFAERFGVRPAEWHSQVSPRKTRAHLGGGGERRNLRRRRRALGAVSAVSGSRLDRRR